jgi:hypothetical protein
MADGLRDGTFDPKRHPLLLVAATLSLGIAAQLVGRVLRNRTPYDGAPEGEVLSEELVRTLLTGVGKPLPSSPQRPPG